MRLLFAALLLASPLRLAGAPPNILLICIDDLRPELRCYGAGYIHSPNIDRLAAQGRLFERHYVQAPTCGASRYTLLMGRYDREGNDNEALFIRARETGETPAHPSLPGHFRNNGYTTVSVGKVSHHPGGRGGPDWDDDSRPEMPGDWDRHLQPVGPWRHPRGVMHGLAHGEIRRNAGEMEVYQAEPGPDDIYPDGLITAEALDQLGALKQDGKPFFLAVGLIRPHLPFGAPKRYLDLYADAALPPIPHPEKPAGPSTWHPSAEFKRYNLHGRDPNRDADFADAVRRHYAACVSYADAQVGRLLERLEDLGLGKNTIVILWGDHGWHLGEHAVWGKHTLFEESLRAPLIVRAPKLPHPGRGTAAVVGTLDLFPTLCALTGLEPPPQLDGVSLLPQLKDPAATGRPALSYYKTAKSLRTDTHRLILHADGQTELYDHRSDPGETRNIAESEPRLVRDLEAEIRRRLR